MKNIIYTIICVLVFVVSCSKTNNDPCNSLNCNTGYCESGECICPIDYAGIDCSQYIPIQERLDQGVQTAREILENGVPEDSLIGKFYKGGLILEVHEPFINACKIVAPAQYEINGSWNQSRLNIAYLNINGYTDWKLPSRPELETMYNRFHLGVESVGSFSEDWYWSFEEYDNDNAYVFGFQSVEVDRARRRSKIENNIGRPIRATDL